MEKLAKAPKLLQEVMDMVKNLGTDIPNFAKYINSPEGQEEIKKIGREASAKKFVTGWQVVPALWPDKSALKANAQPPKKEKAPRKKGVKK